ncbi:hypothetical protein Bca4012_089714 [Brassica carinata]
MEKWVRVEDVIVDTAVEAVVDTKEIVVEDVKMVEMDTVEVRRGSRLESSSSLPLQRESSRSNNDTAATRSSFQRLLTAGVSDARQIHRQLPSTEPSTECPAATKRRLQNETNSKTLTALPCGFTASHVREIVCTSTLCGGERKKTRRRDSRHKGTAIPDVRSTDTNEQPFQSELNPSPND